MRKIPTDRELLAAIYDRYYDTFAAFDPDAPEGEASRSSAVYVPIDIEAVGEDLGMHPEIVFGRLYYDLEQRHGHTDDQGVRSPFFAIRFGGDRHAIHFPRLAALLATLDDRERRYRLATAFSLISLFIAVTSFFISIFT